MPDNNNPPESSSSQEDNENSSSNTGSSGEIQKIKIPDNTQLQKISPGSVLNTKERQEAILDLTGLNPLQQAGVVILKYVGIVAGTVIAVIFAVSFLDGEKNISLPPPPQSPISPSSNQPEEVEQYRIAIDQYERSIDQYERLITIRNKKKKDQEERAVNLFQAFIITGLLPTFTSILGYIFGSQVNNQNIEEEIDESETIS